MANYTVSVMNLINSGFDFGLEDYPIFNEEYRNTLNSKLLYHYYTDQIGLETAGLFKFHLNRAMNEIMPYYNQLYQTTLYKYDPTNSYNLLEESLAKDEMNRTHNDTIGDKLTRTGKNTDNITSNTNADTNTTGNADSKQLFSDTPQGILANGDIENEVYLTNATLNSTTDTTNANSKSNSDSNRTSNVNETEDRNGTNQGTAMETGERNITKKTSGNIYYNVPELVKAFRESILNIDMMIINDPAIVRCFMLIY